jgi:hypothetical protein
MPWKHWSSNRSQSAADAAAANAEAASSLQSQIDGLLLASQAMWELVRERTGLTEEDLRQRMEEIDLRDGIRDGRVGPAKVNCPACNRTNNDRRTHCVYCGRELAPEQADGAV